VTPLGTAVIETLIAEVPKITTPDLTVKMEEMLRLVEFGKMSPEEFYEQTFKEVKSVTYELKMKEREIGLRLFRAVNMFRSQGPIRRRRRKRKVDDGSPYRYEGFRRYLSEP